MDQKEILNFCLQKGILLDKEVLNLFSESTDLDSIKLMIENIQESTHKKIITKSVFCGEHWTSYLRQIYQRIARKILKS